MRIRDFLGNFAFFVEIFVIFFVVELSYNHDIAICRLVEDVSQFLSGRLELSWCNTILKYF